MKKISASAICVGNIILGTSTSDGKRIYGRFVTPLNVDSIFMHVRLSNAVPSDGKIRINVNGKLNKIFPNNGCASFLANEILWIQN